MRKYSIDFDLDNEQQRILMNWYKKQYAQAPVHGINLTLTLLPTGTHLKAEVLDQEQVKLATHKSANELTLHDHKIENENNVQFAQFKNINLIIGQCPGNCLNEKNAHVLVGKKDQYGINRYSYFTVSDWSYMEKYRSNNILSGNKLISQAEYSQIEKLIALNWQLLNRYWFKKISKELLSNIKGLEHPLYRSKKHDRKIFVQQYHELFKDERNALITFDKLMRDALSFYQSEIKHVVKDISGSRYVHWKDKTLLNHTQNDDQTIPVEHRDKDWILDHEFDLEIRGYLKELKFPNNYLW
ncbi:hypothetical protein BMR05_05660 [Methylococcaceae bacterium HT4]|nr:hypothetical protein BMR11_06285 [Methylococcaceae bacterium CS5]TXL02597.1 hypothetical protein BMR07_17440 [Methylococcaceae bacterium CS1]TXL14938.1 hypothetical protein BMR05_05660 [Methylococcaceae bacterium HT4]TXL19356.1 hypothetical protein BMR03_15305 [Methylococcaceae bacterium HT2]